MKGALWFQKEKRLLPPVFESPGSKQPSPRRGANFRVMLHVGAFAGVMNEHILKGAIILKQANIPWSGVKRRDFDKEPPSLATFKKHKQECALYRYAFTGK